MLCIYINLPKISLKLNKYSNGNLLGDSQLVRTAHQYLHQQLVLHELKTPTERNK